MTAKDIVLWMNEKGSFSCRLLPELDLYQDFPEVKKDTMTGLLVTHLKHAT
jgi:hypothetical protein